MKQPVPAHTQLNRSILCPAGSFCPIGSSAPSLCPAGYYCSLGVFRPTLCATAALPGASTCPPPAARRAGADEASAAATASATGGRRISSVEAAGYALCTLALLVGSAFAVRASTARKEAPAMARDVPDAGPAPAPAAHGDACAVQGY